jgi:hypothetical protein
MEPGVPSDQWVENDARELLERIGIQNFRVLRVFPDHILFTRKHGEKTVAETAWLFLREGYRRPVVRVEEGWPATRGVLFPDEEK